MRRFLTVFLFISLVSSFGGGSHAATNPIQQEQESVKALTNQDILTLVKSGLSAEVISAKLQRSGCTCDISSPELLRLKAEGVADEILFAMIKSTKAGSGERIMVTIPRDTKRPSGLGVHGDGVWWAAALRRLIHLVRRHGPDLPHGGWA